MQSQSRLSDRLHIVSSDEISQNMPEFIELIQNVCNNAENSDDLETCMEKLLDNSYLFQYIDINENILQLLFNFLQQQIIHNTSANIIRLLNALLQNSKILEKLNLDNNVLNKLIENIYDEALDIEYRIQCFNILKSFAKYSQQNSKIILEITTFDDLLELYYYDIQTDYYIAVLQLFIELSKFEYSEVLTGANFDIIYDILYDKNMDYFVHSMKILSNFIKFGMNEVNSVKLDLLVPVIFDIELSDAIIPCVIDFIQKMSNRIDLTDILLENGIIDIIVHIIGSNYEDHNLLFIINNMISWKEENLILIFGNETLRRYIFDTLLNGSYTSSLAAAYCLTQIISLKNIEIIEQNISQNIFDMLLDFVDKSELRFTIFFLKSLISLSDLGNRHIFEIITNGNDYLEHFEELLDSENETIRNLASIIIERNIFRFE